MPNSPIWHWDSPRRQPVDPSIDSPWNFDQISNQSPGLWHNDNEDYNLWDDFDLTLPPINPGNLLENIPPLSPALLGALSRRQSASSEGLFVSEASHSQDPPPPSNQQARVQEASFQAPSPLPFFYRPNSPDPFEEFSNLTPPPRTMAPSNHTRSSSYVDLTASSPTQPRANAPPSKKRKRDQSEERPSKSGKSPLKSDDDAVECVNLEDVETFQDYEDMKAKQEEEVIKAQNQAEATKPLKLAEFKCIICMDDPTDLTVTHCGHLFCSECLHQALHAGDRKCCPVCRTPIVVPRPGQKPAAKSYFPLSLKLTTAKRHGKRPVRV